MKAKKITFEILKFFAFLSLGVFLLWYTYKDQDIKEIWRQTSNFNYWIIFLSLIVALLSHVSRALRWMQITEVIGYKPSFFNSFAGVMVTYIGNMVIPRLGEVSRCTLLKKYEKMSVSKSFGTIVMERIIDVFMLLVLTLVSIFTQWNVFAQFYKNNPKIKDKFDTFQISNATIIITILIFILLVFIGYFIRKKYRTTNIYLKFKKLILNFWEGMKAVKKVRNQWLFWFHTIFIWVAYFVMIQICFYAFEPTSHLSIFAGLTVFVLASYGMVAPVQGGIGVWHFMVIATLIVYGIDDVAAGAFAAIVFAIQTALVVGVGVLCVVLMPIVNKNYKPKHLVKEDKNDDKQ